ncbi:MAG: hypothetical protein E6L07_03065 [Verrucomicrobia bacterium]|nr:MAG: hypothetical protein E6L07_03065 [Verrucomicrobiota bacterium]
MRKPYHLLTEAQKGLRRAAKKRWRDKNPAKQRTLTLSWQRKNRDRVNKQYRDRYAANPELYRAKLKAKRERMGEKYRAQIKRSRTKTRSTTEGMLYHRMSQSVRSALLGSKRKCKWENLLGYSVEELKAHLESQFTEGMTWDKFFGGGIHIDHVIPRMNFNYISPNDLQFKQCWALSNLRPIWPKENSVSGAHARWNRLKRAV